MKLRIKFSKHGNVRFIGHLDLQRYFQKAMRRAYIDIAYSTGYSPHQIMSFAAPLGVGLESNGEYMDIEVNSYLGNEETVKRLNSIAADGIVVLSAKVLPEGSKNAMASVAAASYTVSFREGREPSFLWQDKLTDFFSKSFIPYTKITEKNKFDINLKDGIYKLECTNHNSIYMLVDASSSGNLKPATIINTFLQQYGEELKPNALIITREDTYLNIGSDDENHFVPLDFIAVTE